MSNPDIVWLYPESSCPQQTCAKSYPIPPGPPTNMSVNGCNLSPYFDCYYRATLGEKITPQAYTERRDLNPQVVYNKLAPNFGKIPCTTQGCPSPNYISQDPRLFDVPRAEYLRLDQPPTDGTVLLKNVYDANLDNYSRTRENYADIGDGQISYYIDESIQDAFFSPVFSEPAIQRKILYKDPMGSIQTVYDRIPIINTENPTTVSPDHPYPYSLSFIQDTQSFREDLMAIQQRKNNREKYSARWAP